MVVYGRHYLVVEDNARLWIHQSGAKYQVDRGGQGNSHAILVYC